MFFYRSIQELSIPFDHRRRDEVGASFHSVEVFDKRLEQSTHRALFLKKFSEFILSHLLVYQKIFVDQFANVHQKTVILIVAVQLDPAKELRRKGDFID